MSTMSPTVLRAIVFPPAFGPEMTSALRSPSQLKSSGLTARPAPSSANRFSRSGWRAPRRASAPSGAVLGHDAAEPPRELRLRATRGRERGAAS